MSAPADLALKVKATGSDWLKTLALAAAPYVQEGSFRVVTLDHHGAITVRKAYASRTAAHGQQTRLANQHEVNAYVLTRFGAEVTVWNGPRSRILRIEVGEPKGDVGMDLRRARARIENPDAWLRKYLACRSDGEPTDPDSENAVCWCARGALEAEGCYVLAEGEDLAELGDAPEQEPWWWLHMEANRSGYSSIESFNDSQSHAEVLRLFDRAIARAEAV